MQLMNNITMKKDFTINKDLNDGVGFIAEPVQSYQSNLSISATLTAVAAQDIKLGLYAGVDEQSMTKVYYHEDGEDKALTLDILIGERVGQLRVDDMNPLDHFQLKIEDAALVGVISTLKINY